MSTKTEAQGSRHFLEAAKWLIVVILLIVAIVGNYYYRNSNLPLRALTIILIMTVAGTVMLITNKGKAIVTFVRETRPEVRKVIWPTYKETLHTMLIVVVVTIVMSMILWGLDSFLVRLVSFITGLRF